MGTETAHPPGVPFDDESVIDSDGLLSLKQLPKSLTIVGGGVIGCEYACILATLGIPVVLVERRPRLLEFVDSEIIESLQYQMRNIGVTLRLNEEVVGVSIGADKSVVLHLKSGKQIRSPLLVYSAGRVGATKNLGLEQVGIEPDERGRLKVNENFQTCRAAYLRGRRRGGISRPRVDFDATRPSCRLPCFRSRLRDILASIAVRNLHDPGNFDGRTQRRRAYARRRSL